MQSHKDSAKNGGPSKLISYPDLLSTRLCQQEIWVRDYIQMEIVKNYMYIEKLIPYPLAQSPLDSFLKVL